tara:strand:+ start:642 stop:866 length:225 start_codon:yes stop_codon:yes gene_type:complete
MKYKITGTYEVIFDTKGLPQFTKGINGEMVQDDVDELNSEWIFEGAQLISEKLVPCLEPDSVELIHFDIERKQQ